MILKTHIIIFILLLGIMSIQAQADSLARKENIVLVDTNNIIPPTEINLKEITKLVGYPPKAIKKRIEGKIVFRVLVDENGNYVKHLPPNSGDPILIEAVEKHLPEVRFTPCIKNGTPIKFWVNIPFYFYFPQYYSKPKKKKK